MLSALAAAACFLAYCNGANDNFKGVATLFGSGTADYRRALAWATLTTFAGSAASVALAGSLLATFSGAGLVPPELAGAPAFLSAVALGAGLTVLLATLTGFPVSTTHALTGALAGAGLTAAGARVSLAALGGKFFLPLLVSPLLALLLGGALYALLRYARLSLGIGKEWCVCLGATRRVIPIPQPAPALFARSVTLVEPALDARESCALRYNGAFAGVPVQSLLDAGHYASAGLASFARGLNDTPKIAALLLAVQGLGPRLGLLAVALAMALGGALQARRVAETMSLRITPLSPGQGLSANLATAGLVLFASGLGVPVSTTHVSVGALFGIGAITGKADLSVVRDIALSWVLTLPVAAAFTAAAWRLSAW